MALLIRRTGTSGVTTDARGGLIEFVAGHGTIPSLPLRHRGSKKESHRFVGICCGPIELWMVHRIEGRVIRLGCFFPDTFGSSLCVVLF